MKLKSFIVLALLSATSCYAQSITPQVMKANVIFERDSTDLIAIVYQQDTVNVLYKMMFGKPVTGPLPANGRYAINYSAEEIQFDALKGSKSYTFSLSDAAPITAKPRNRWETIIGLSRMNPVCFPRKPKEQPVE